MSVIIINGPNKLSGQLKIQGAKNSALPILSACVLCKGQSVIHNCPKLTDVKAAVSILENLNCKCKWENDSLIVDSSDVKCKAIPENLMREMRSSIVFLGAILGRCKKAMMSFPGGCELGARPIDLHLLALKRLGTQIDESQGFLMCEVKEKLQGNYINLSFPSVGATENIMLAASVANGRTIIENAAREPEITDLANFLNICGAKIIGAGSSNIIIDGVKELNGGDYSVMSDRIVTATYLAAAAITGGEILLKNCPKEGVKNIFPIFEESGCRVIEENDNIYLSAPKKLKSLGKIRTMPYPGFPTDAQAPIMAMACLAEGSSVFVENIFESRFKHAGELARLGAKINIEGKVAIVQGVDKLWGANLQSRELRGGASLVVAALASYGKSSIIGTEFIDRGYENLEENLRGLGAKIYREE
ncbi:MAG: UDP-N-acetylglucosamine 1-carboxyvinyltransferase [Clostridia bacterium]